MAPPKTERFKATVFETDRVPPKASFRNGATEDRTCISKPLSLRLTGWLTEAFLILWIKASFKKLLYVFRFIARYSFCT